MMFTLNTTQSPVRLRLLTSSSLEGGGGSDGTKPRGIPPHQGSLGSSSRRILGYNKRMPTETARVPEDISGRLRRLPVGEVSWRHTFRALRHRNYRLFFWGQLVSLIGTWMQQTAMSWFVYEITNSKFLLGAVAAVG